MKVLSDILDAADSRQVTLLGLLDLSAAFDTIDHDILLRRLATSFGISGLTLKWISSFLTVRTQAVVFRGATSAFSTVTHVVPQVGLPDFQSRNTGDFFTIAAIGVGAQSTLGRKTFLPENICMKN